MFTALHLPLQVHPSPSDGLLLWDSLVSLQAAFKFWSFSSAAGLSLAKMEDEVWLEACEELKPLLLDKSFIKLKKRKILAQDELLEK